MHRNVAVISIRLVIAAASGVVGLASIGFTVFSFSFLLRWFGIIHLIRKFCEISGLEIIAVAATFSLSRWGSWRLVRIIIMVYILVDVITFGTVVVVADTSISVLT